MTGVMLVKQRVASVGRWNNVFRDPELDATRRRHGLVVTGTYIDGDDPLAGVEMEGSTRYNDADEIMSEYFRQGPGRR